MALFPILFLVVSITATSVTSTTVPFATKYETGEERTGDSWDGDIGIKTKLEETLLEKLEQFREKMRSPQPEFNLPTLDPFSAGNFKVNTSRPDQIEVTGNVTAATIEGLSTFEITRLKLYIVQAKGVLRLTYPQLTIKSNYDLHGNMSIIRIPTYGRGNVTLTLHNVSLEALPHFQIVGNHLAVSKLNLDWNPAAWLEVSMDGLYCTSSELSAVVGRIFSDLTPRLLRNYKPILLAYADDILFRSINQLLAKLSLDDIIGLIPHNSTTMVH